MFVGYCRYSPSEIYNMDGEDFEFFRERLDVYLEAIKKGRK